MHSIRIIASLGALISIVAAVPMKRDVITNTVTEIDVVTEMVTATVWVDAAETTASSDSAQYTQAEHYPHPTWTWTTSAAPAEITHAAPTTWSSIATSSSSSVYVAPPAPTTTSTSTPQVEPTTTSVYVAPTTPATTSTSQWVEPTSVYRPPVEATTTAAYVPPVTTPTTATYVPPVLTPTTTSTTAAAAATTTTSSSSGSYTGSITYYDVGLGSCGNTNTDSEMVVAMAAGMMDKSTMCGKTITINYGGKSQQATVVDTCPGCAVGGLDLSPTLFQVFASLDAGRVQGVTWSFN